MALCAALRSAQSKTSLRSILRTKTTMRVVGSRSSAEDPEALAARLAAQLAPEVAPTREAAPTRETTPPTESVSAAPTEKLVVVPRRRSLVGAFASCLRPPASGVVEPEGSRR